MNFKEQLNAYIDVVGCSAADLAHAADISPSTISRYRSGRQLPKQPAIELKRIATALASFAAENELGCSLDYDYMSIYTDTSSLSFDTILANLIACDDIILYYPEAFTKHFQTVIDTTEISLADLARALNFDASYLSRIKAGQRQPAQPKQFATELAHYLWSHCDRKCLLMFCHEAHHAVSLETLEESSFAKYFLSWFLHNDTDTSMTDSVNNFLSALDKFDLNEYIRAIHFGSLKVIALPFTLPTSKHYYGLDEMKQAELDFLKTTVLAKEQTDVIMYSNMEMADMAEDVDFAKKYMFGLAIMLKKGLHLHVIHNLNRPFDELMLGLENWIPLYMTGQISPYYFKHDPDPVFGQLLNVSGHAALSGECICGHHAEGRYYLTRTRQECHYYKKKASYMLDKASPLMKIYRAEDQQSLYAFLHKDVSTPGARLGILSALPLYTLSESLLQQILKRNHVPTEERSQILSFAQKGREYMLSLLEHTTVTDNISQISPEEWESYPQTLQLADLFCTKTITYTYDEYTSHLEQTLRFAKEHANYSVQFTKQHAFRNIQIYCHQNKWVMVSKANEPAIHFIIHHPLLVHAICNISIPIYDDEP